MNRSERIQALKQFAEEHKPEGYNGFDPSSTMSLKSGIILLLSTIAITLIFLILINML